MGIKATFKAISEKPEPWILLAGLVVLGFLLLFIGLLWSQTYESVYHDYAASKANPDAGYIFEKICTKTNLSTVDDALRCAKEAVESARETQRAEEDVYAQKQMAKWAWWLLIFTSFIGVVSVAITGFGTYFLLRTVRFAGEANKVAMRIGQAQVRAYLTCKQAEYSVGRGAVFCYPVIENKGQSPARNISISGKIEFQESRDGKFLMGETVECHGICEVTPAGGEREGMIVFSERMIGADHFMRASQEYILRVLLNISWVDVFKKQQDIQVSLFTVKSPSSIGSLSMQHQGLPERKGMRAFNRQDDVPDDNYEGG